MPLTECTHQTLSRQGQGGWCWPASSVPRWKTDVTKGALGPLVTIGKCEVEKKMVTSDFTHRGFVNLALLALNFYCRHRSFSPVREENFLYDMKGKYNKWMLQKCCYFWERD